MGGVTDLCRNFVRKCEVNKTREKPRHREMGRVIVNWFQPAQDKRPVTGFYIRSNEAFVYVKGRESPDQLNYCKSLYELVIDSKPLK